MLGCSILYSDLSRNSHGVVTDNITKLQWQDNIPASNMVWMKAIDYCETLKLDGEGWRLPQIKELKSIVDNDGEKMTINNSFKHTNTFAYWSSTPVTKYSGTVWGNYLYYGMSYWDTDNTHCYVKCVRDKE